MRHLHKLYICSIWLLLIMLLSCGKDENPPRDEIPSIKDVLADFERAVKDRNAVRIDSLMIAEAYELGYNSARILAETYPDPDESSFYTFGRRDFYYTKDKAKVNCVIMSDSTDPGRPVEITLVKAGNRWLIKRFDLK